MSTFTERLVGAATLQARIFEEVEADRTATTQAIATVALSSVAGGIGAAAVGGGLAAGSLIGGTVASLVGWMAWAALTYLIGTRVLPEPQTRADMGELLRTTGFAAAPGLLRVLGLVPGLFGVVFLLTSIWSLAAMVVGVRQALDYTSTGRAIAVCVVGWVVSLALVLLVGSFFGSPVQ
jgi:hypothetical protein